MRVSLADAAALLRREQDFLNGVSPSEGALTSDEIMNSTQWVDAVVGELRDAACMAHERV
eukprot:2285247-Alexandrium_andersonii.AAC.1